MPAPASVIAIPALAPAVRAAEAVKETVAVVDVAATLDARATERSYIHEIAGNLPDAVESMMAGAVTDKSFEVPAATLLKAACAFDGVANDVTTTATREYGLYVPASSLTVKTAPAREAAHAGLPADGAVTVHALLPASAMPAPDSVRAMPALAPAAMAPSGVNEMVAVVDEALTPDARVIASAVIAPVIAGNVPLVVASMMTGA